MSTPSDAFTGRAAPPRGSAADTPKRLAAFVAGRASASIGRIGRYSAFVGFMRYALPLSAVLLLGLIVVWPLVSGREDGFRVTYSTRVEEDGSLKMLNARYIGTDGKGQPYKVEAAEAIPSAADQNVIVLKSLAAEMDRENGSWLTMSANEGLYDRNASTLDLAGAVSLFRLEEYGEEYELRDELHTERAHVDIDAGTAEGDEPVFGQGRHGLIEGNAFSVSERGDNLFLYGGVKATIFPKGADGSEAQ